VRRTRMARRVGFRLDAETQRHRELPGLCSPTGHGVAEKTVDKWLQWTLVGTTVFRDLRSQRP